MASPIKYFTKYFLVFIVPFMLLGFVACCVWTGLSCGWMAADKWLEKLVED